MMLTKCIVSEKSFVGSFFASQTLCLVPLCFFFVFLRCFSLRSGIIVSFFISSFALSYAGHIFNEKLLCVCDDKVMTPEHECNHLSIFNIYERYCLAVQCAPDDLIRRTDILLSLLGSASRCPIVCDIFVVFLCPDFEWGIMIAILNNRMRNRENASISIHTQWQNSFCAWVLFETNLWPRWEKCDPAQSQDTK